MNNWEGWTKRRAPLAIIASALSVGVWFVASTREAAANDERGMEVVAKEPEKCGVLVVGVDKYDNLPPLNYASSDAKNIADALKRLGIAEKSVRLLATGVEGSQEPKREEIWKAFEEILAASNEESTVVIALSGHGFEAIKDGETSGDAAFCPADVEARTEKGKTIVKADTAILLKDVVERLQKDDAKFKVLIVDACREPAAIKSVASKGAKSPFNVPKARGLTIFQSCGPEEYSYEDSRLKGGVFTHFFVEGLNGEGVGEGVSFWDACKHALAKTKNYVQVELKQTQNPSLNIVGVEDFWLRPPTDDSGDSWLPWALLALTGGLAGVAVWGRRKPEPESEPKSKPEPESKPKSKPEPESKPKSKSEPESKPDKRRVVFPLPSAPSEKKERPRETWTLDGVEYAFRSCPSGTFDMGSPATETGRNDDETRRRVILTREYWMQETPVTVGMMRSFVKATGYRMGDGSNGNGGWGYDSSGVFGQSLDYVWEEPGFRSGFRPTDAHPATQIDWYGANAFCDWLNKELRSQLPSDLKFRLPTEAEWERACRAGTTTPYFWGSSLNGDKANCNGDKPYGTSAKGEFFERTTEVGSYAANPWGLRDMHGDVWEWCADWYGEYGATSLTDPTGARSGTRRVLRGGCWSGEAKSCRSAARSCADPASRYCYCGFRLVLGREL